MSDPESTSKSKRANDFFGLNVESFLDSLVIDVGRRIAQRMFEDSDGEGDSGESRQNRAISYQYTKVGGGKYTLCVTFAKTEVGPDYEFPDQYIRVPVGGLRREGNGSGKAFLAEYGGRTIRVSGSSLKDFLEFFGWTIETLPSLYIGSENDPEIFAVDWNSVRSPRRSRARKTPARR